MEHSEYLEEVMQSILKNKQYTDIIILARKEGKNVCALSVEQKHKAKMLFDFYMATNKLI